jgi:hypothetical protein
MRLSPFKGLPSPAAVPHHCGPCLLAVTVARIPEGKAPPPITIAGERLQHPVRAGDRGRRHEVQPTSRLCSAVESVAPRHRFRCAAPAPPMGFFPLRGPSASAPARTASAARMRFEAPGRRAAALAALRLGSPSEGRDRSRNRRWTEPRASLQWFPAEHPRRGLATVPPESVRKLGSHPEWPSLSVAGAREPVPMGCRPPWGS